MKTLISNPPYNLKWQYSNENKKRFENIAIPPEKNANFVFILEGFLNSEKCAFILPLNILTTEIKEEKKIIKYLTDNNFIEAVIKCPDKMFEKTSIPVFILLLNKKKNNSYIEMIDMSNNFEIEKREQKAQYGSNSHTKRIYKKEIKIFNDKHIEQIIDIINNKKNEINISKAVSIEEIKNKNYIINPTIYIEKEEEIIKTRTYDDIIKDLNRIIKEKNKLKITCNESLANKFGLTEVFNNLKNSQELNNEINNELKLINKNIEKENFISLSKNKNELIFKNNDKEDISHILILILQQWKNHIYYLNQQENIYLTELRDKLLPDLLSGKINLEEDE